ncbi:MAG: DsbA family protein [Alphaproteobacteria bacterium]|nr:DsbA family protein [Alphaproteobacteria bacterium]
MEGAVKAAIRVLTLLVLLAGGTAGAADTSGLNPIDQTMGSPDAKLTIIEYASLTCPHCAHFHETMLPRMKAEWIDTGKARLIYRDFPTSPQALAVGAAMVDQCAGNDRYFGVLGLLFQTQEKWVTAPNPLAEIKRIVRVAGITAADVDACLERQDLAGAIQARAMEGNKKYGIDSTPSLVIDGKLYPAFESYEKLDYALQDAWRAVSKK